MAYLTKDDIVIIKNGSDTLQSRVMDVRFRRYRSSYKDRKTGKKKTRMKSMPYAVCSVFIGTSVPAGTEFLIPGYKLRNEVKDGEKLLLLRDQYAAEFDGAWVEKILTESKEKRV